MPFPASRLLIFAGRQLGEQQLPFALLRHQLGVPPFHARMQKVGKSMGRWMKIMGFNGILMGFYSDLLGFIMIYWENPNETHRKSRF